MLDDKFLFPFEHVAHNSQILIYGAGELGQAYAKQIMITGYCNLLGMIDRNYKNYVDTAIPVYPPYSIHTLSFDRIVVALKNPGGCLKFGVYWLMRVCLMKRLFLLENEIK